jgi:hypothetical protein
MAVASIMMGRFATRSLASIDRIVVQAGAVVDTFWLPDRAATAGQVYRGYPGRQVRRSATDTFGLARTKCTAAGDWILTSLLIGVGSG